MSCHDCPRACGADRTRAAGFCGVGINAQVAKTIPGFLYEEPCLGKVTAVFFGGCNLKCSYCQNIAISRGGRREVTDGELAAIFDSTSEPIDLVTPTPALSAIERAVVICTRAHLFIYNTSGYETEDGVRRAAGFSDIFLTDFKYGENEVAARLSGVRDYVERATSALRIMRQKRDVYSKDGILKSGLIVRHLVLPGHVQSSIRALDIIAAELGTDVILSLMSQFTPNGVGEPSAPLKKIEYKLVREHALSLGFNNGYFQDMSSANARFTPEF